MNIFPQQNLSLFPAGVSAARTSPAAWQASKWGGGYVLWDYYYLVFTLEQSLEASSWDPGVAVQAESKRHFLPQTVYNLNRGDWWQIADKEAALLRHS